jgi:uncharacterized protein involved in exopolysaccharide biosynthesis
VAADLFPKSPKIIELEAQMAENHRKMFGIISNMCDSILQQAAEGGKQILHERLQAQIGSKEREIVQLKKIIWQE